MEKMTTFVLRLIIIFFGITITIIIHNDRNYLGFRTKQSGNPKTLNPEKTLNHP